MSRLRFGEYVAAAAGAVLLALLVAVPWFERRDSGLSAWREFAFADILLAVAGISAVALAVLTVTRRSPSLPLFFATIALLCGGLGTFLVLLRLLGGDTLAGGYAGLVAAILVTYGTWRSLREDVRTGPGYEFEVDRRPTPPATPAQS